MILFVVAMAACLGLCVSAWPLKPFRYLSAMAFAFIMVMSSMAAVKAAEPSTEECSAAVNLAAGALEWRKSGISEDVAMEFLRQQKVYSGLPVWAVKSAYNAPEDVTVWIFKGDLMSQCRNRDK